LMRTGHREPRPGRAKIAICARLCPISLSGAARRFAFASLKPPGSLLVSAVSERTPAIAVTAASQRRLVDKTPTHRSGRGRAWPTCYAGITLRPLGESGRRSRLHELHLARTRQTPGRRLARRGSGHTRQASQVSRLAPGVAEGHLCPPTS
jgi:hypothetical protein